MLTVLPLQVSVFPQVTGNIFQISVGNGTDSTAEDVNRRYLNGQCHFEFRKYTSVKQDNGFNLDLLFPHRTRKIKDQIENGLQLC